MKHLGDITQINGADIEPVDVIIGGSPCQDLSVAGNRAGLDGERSGLFMEQIRIVREMRNATNDNAARYMVWENVPGAFSSNKAEDFRIVLEETARVADSNAVIPRPPGGKWPTAGCIMGDGWSIAWRVQDAQFWGVPQRRRRIALVADFGGQSAPEILFEREGVSGDIAESGTKGEGVAGGVEKGTTYAIDISEPVTYPGVGITSKQNASKGTPGVCHTLNQDNRNYVVAGFCQGASPAAQTIGYQEEVSPTIKGAPSGTAQVPAVCYPINDKATRYQGGGATRNKDGSGNGLGIGKDGDPAPTLTSGDKHAVFDARGNGDGSIATYSFQRTDELKESQVSSTQSARQYKSPTDLVYETVGALCARDYKGVGSQYVDEGKCVQSAQSVRRLTPLECERLQGFPDNWTNIPPQTEVTAEDLSFWRTVWDEWDDMNGKKRHTDKQIVKWLKSEAADSARYKALGNSIALPPWRFVLYRIRALGAATMGSLFDGIGGFPLIWNESGGRTLWASEIEPFCIAVTEYHFNA